MNLQRLMVRALPAMFVLVAHADEFATMPVRIETASRAHELTVEIAATYAQRARGLMARDTLAPDAGMLFVYDKLQPGDAGFWMYRTRIPLDIAFLGADGDIRAILSMQPCHEEQGARCPSYLPRVPYFAAIEVNGGYFAANGIAPGDRVLFVPPGRVAAKQGAQ